MKMTRPAGNRSTPLLIVLVLRHPEKKFKMKRTLLGQRYFCSWSFFMTSSEMLFIIFLPATEPDEAPEQAVGLHQQHATLHLFSFSSLDD